MPHVSRGRMKQDSREKIHRGFFRLVTAMHGTIRPEQFLRELLTPTETVMLTKRLAALVMLCRGYSGYKVHTALKVSPSTTTRLRRRLDDGAFPYIELAFRGYRKKRAVQSDNFLDVLERLLLMGMPPRCGRGRWKFLFDKK